MSTQVQTDYEVVCPYCRKGNRYTVLSALEKRSNVVECLKCRKQFVLDHSLLPNVLIRKIEQIPKENDIYDGRYPNV